ncbi:alpha/beta hydrolase [Nocardioides baekrokdamisoli]|uniref:Alpha/beta hydrolase n=1 Tax=Nocardioides baekrokdamisoli TaxID=1804624 RepID=A0A3G9IGI7_9ACTN|nr:alpha/beta hydrolase [Nocardioides baekrokdamisoli]BBH17436.1 alpha/beta hydrolase [Nocardioides baekrokdamisoli]
MYDFEGETGHGGDGTMPSRSLLLLELPRWIGEYAASSTLDRVRPRRGIGSGRPVLVLPGFSATDGMTGRLRSHLDHRGFAAHGWGQGRNIGLTDTLIDGLHARFEDLRTRYDQPVSVVGWSFGGVLARHLAHTYPDDVRQIICLGSPWRPDGERTRATAMFEKSREKHGISDRARPIVEQLRQPVPVPTTAVWSKSDGVVPWRGCMVDASSDPIAENIEVVSSHVGMVASPLTLMATVDRLSQDPNGWQAFSWRTCASGQGAPRTEVSA